MSDYVPATLLASAPVAHDVREFTFRRADGASWEYQAGQYVNIVLGEQRVVRAYSICTWESGSDTLRIVANLVPGGAGTPHLFALQPGTQCELSRPLGSFVLNEASTRDCLFVATGTGVAPLRAMLQRLYAEKPDHRALLLWGLRSERDVYYLEELDAMAQRYPNFTFLPTLSQPQAEWDGLVGRVTTHLPEYVKSVDNLEAYLCGNEAMIDEVRAYLKSLGLCPVRTEKFY